MREMRERLRKFHLELEDSKTRVLQFGRFARENAARGGREPETFEFLGFTHHCGQTRFGSFKLQRRTSKKKFRGKLKDLKRWIQANRTQKTSMVLRGAKVRLRGWLNYYAITDNGRSCMAFRSQFERLLYKWLNRRSQKRSYTWEQFSSALLWVGWPRIHINRRLDPFRRVGPNEC